MKKLIVNADDFGFSEAYNYGVIHSFEHGVATSASIMTNMDAAVHAAALAKMHPKLGVSLHMNIVQGKCCADPATIPSIVQPDGSFYRSGEYKADGVIKKGNGSRIPNKEDVKRETRAQLERFKMLLGYYPVHMEGHSIIHEAIQQGLWEVAQEYGIHCMAFDGRKQEGYLNVSSPLLDNGEVMQFLTDYHVTGLSAESLIRFLETRLISKQEVIAFHCHPGYVDATIMDASTLVLQRCRDVQALCDPRVAQWVKDNNIELIGYDSIKIA